jgi:hypothetical protein
MIVALCAPVISRTNTAGAQKRQPRAPSAEAHTPGAKTAAVVGGTTKPSQAQPEHAPFDHSSAVAD